MHYLLGLLLILIGTGVNILSYLTYMKMGELHTGVIFAFTLVIFFGIYVIMKGLKLDVLKLQEG